jgi:hypothetical protein
MNYYELIADIHMINNVIIFFWDSYDILTKG